MCKKLCLSVLFLISFLWIGSFSSSQAIMSEVHVITLDDLSINPVTAEYIIKAINRAEDVKAEALVIKLDTPGGLLTSTRLIVKRMLLAEVPIVVYVSPQGSRAGSAGVFLTYASHVAAMAPSTNIGAAHPVSLTGTSPHPKERQWEEIKELIKKIPTSEKTDKNPEEEAVSEESDEQAVPDENPMESKILQDTVAFIKAIATERGRNVEWGIESVVKSASITAKEALDKQVIDIIAESDRDLLEQLDGRVLTVNDQEVTLQTKDARMEHISMTAKEKFFNALADPNIAYFLLILGFYGLLFEVTHPGFGLPGILGSIFLILAFYSMQTLPTNYAGVALIGLGLILLIAEVYTPTFGLLSMGGLACLVLGSLLLFDSVDPMMRVSKTLIFSTVGTIGFTTLVLLGYLVKGQKRKITGGQEGLIGAAAQVEKVLEKPGLYKVFVHGELWNAVSDDDLQIGEAVAIESVSGMLLKVKKQT